MPFGGFLKNLDLIGNTFLGMKKVHMGLLVAFLGILRRLSRFGSFRVLVWQYNVNYRSSIVIFVTFS